MNTDGAPPHPPPAPQTLPPGQALDPQVQVPPAPEQSHPTNTRPAPALDPTDQGHAEDQSLVPPLNLDHNSTLRQIPLPGQRPTPGQGHTAG